MFDRDIISHHFSAIYNNSLNYLASLERLILKSIVY